MQYARIDNTELMKEGICLLETARMWEIGVNWRQLKSGQVRRNGSLKSMVKQEMSQTNLAPGSHSLPKVAATFASQIHKII